MKKRILSLLLVIVMVAAMLPTISLTASAQEYSSGSTVELIKLKAGDSLRAGAKVKFPSTITDIRIRKLKSDNTNGGYTTESKYYGYSSWTADVNYYVVAVTTNPYRLHLYPIGTNNTSKIVFDATVGTVNGNKNYTATATKYLSDYCDVSWLNPTSPGCTFLGWFTSDGKTMVYDAQGKCVTGDYWKGGTWRGVGDKYFIAKWQATTSITFRYFPNGGAERSDNYVQWYAPADYFASVKSDSHWNYTNGQYKLTRTGHTATGYFAKKDGTCKVHEDDVFTSYTQLCNAYGLNPNTCGNAVIDIYAQWTPHTYTVAFNGNGATGGSTASQDFTYDTDQNLRANGFQQNYTVTYDLGDGSPATSANANSIFSGWNTADDGSGTAYSNQQSVKNLTTIDGATVTLYAQWTPDSVDLPTPTKSGKVCTGWYTSSGTKVGDCGASYTPTGKTTLYAKWETVGYTVTWKNYDGTVLETDEGVAQGVTPTYNGATPTKPDTTEHSYEFDDWSPAISAVSGNVEYTAQFQETVRKYNIRFLYDPDEGEVTGSKREPTGNIVTVDPLPKNGYAVDGIIAYKTDDENTTVDIDSLSYSFTMPDYDVTVEVTWKESEVIYTRAYKDVAPTYTVTIPPTVTLGNTVTVSAENVRVNKGSQLVVSVADATGGENPFTMASAENYRYRFEYGITVDDREISAGANVLTVNPDEGIEGSAVLKFEKPKKAIYAGQYSGSVVFTITVQPVENRR